MTRFLKPLLCAALWVLFPSWLWADEVLRIGVLDYLGSEHSLTLWAATETALNAALPGHTFRLEALDLSAMEEALAEGQLDFVITNPGNYAELEFHHHISRIATAEGDLPVASTLVTTTDLAKLNDLAGKRLAIVSPEAFGGFQVIWSELQAVDPRLPAKLDLVVTGYPMQQVADAVLNGQADAAVLRGCMLEELQALDPDRYGALRAFALNPEASNAEGCALSSPVYPGWPFAKTPKTSPALAKEVAVALMQMEGGNLWTVPLDYQPVHDLMRQLQIGPYARTGPVSLREFIADYRDWLLVLAAALMFWALYSVRIETLVRRRTKALDETNAALSREIAERKRAEEADRQHRRELEHVARLSILGEMASSIAHELNQPLSAISNYAQGCLLRIRAGKFSEEDMTRASEEMAGQADRAATVVKRIRAFVRKRESQMAPVDMAELVAESAAIYEGPVHRAGVTVSLRMDEDVPMVLADRVQIQQVILNLVQNAVDAMSETDPEDRKLALHLQSYDDLTRGHGAALSVRDRGQSMTEAQLDHFAEAFYTTKPEGIGLGLALSRSIIEAHNGWMHARTPTDGVGLEVQFWLPVEKDAG